MSNSLETEVYASLIETVDSTTGAKYLPLVTETAAHINVCRRFNEGDFHPVMVRSAIAEACATGDLFQWTNPTTDTRRLGINDADILESKTESYFDSADRITAAAAPVLKATRERIDTRRADSDD